MIMLLIIVLIKTGPNILVELKKNCLKNYCSLFKKKLPSYFNLDQSQAKQILTWINAAGTYDLRCDYLLFIYKKLLGYEGLNMTIK